MFLDELSSLARPFPRNVSKAFSCGEVKWLKHCVCVCVCITSSCWAETSVSLCFLSISGMYVQLRRLYHLVHHSSEYSSSAKLIWAPAFQDKKKYTLDTLLMFSPHAVCSISDQTLTRQSSRPDLPVVQTSMRRVFCLRAVEDICRLNASLSSKGSCGRAPWVRNKQRTGSEHGSTTTRTYLQ